MNAKTIRLIKQLKKRLARGEKTQRLSIWEVRVTPEFAEYVMSHHNGKNRPISESSTRKYVKTVVAGKWVERTGENIIFATDRHINDGQHRIRTVIKSGKPMLMTFEFGANPEGRLVQGEGNCQKRPDDRLHIVGFRFPRGAATTLTIAHAGYSLNQYGHRPETEQLVQLAERFKKAIHFVAKYLPTAKYVSSMEMRGVVTRAYCSRPKDREKTKRFCEIMREGCPNPDVPEEVTVHSLREWILKTRGFEGIRSSVGSREIYSRVSKHLYAYLEGQVIRGQCLKSSQEMFPLREELRAQKELKTCGNKNWMVPILSNAKNAIRNVVKRNRIVLERDRFSKTIGQGDRMCFYAHGKGVVANATVRSLRFEGDFCEAAVQNVREFFDRPIGITHEVCKKLDAFRKGSYSLLAPSLLVKGVRPVSFRDFMVLTGSQA